MTTDEGNIPPAWQCTRRGCHNEAINPARGDACCKTHHTPSPLDGRLDELAAEADTVTDPGQPDDVVDLNLVGVDEDELTAADFMGGDSPVASDTQPDREPASSSEASYARTVSALPLRQLDTLSPSERKRAARKRGLEWPSTSEARDRLFDTIATVMRHEDDQVIDAPTSLGKSHTVAATRWGARDDLTGSKPVVHLSATRKARDEAAATARAEGGGSISSAAVIARMRS